MLFYSLKKKIKKGLKEKNAEIQEKLLESEKLNDLEKDFGAQKVLMKTKFKELQRLNESTFARKK